jgi:hypothetical protein
MNKKKMKCPLCGRRAFDISKIPKEKLEVELKCPHCKNVVIVPCTEDATMNIP